MTDGPCKRKELLPTTTGIYQIRQPATPFHEKSMEYSLLAQQNLLENETILYKMIVRDESDRRRENYDCMSYVSCISFQFDSRNIIISP
jgi:hypothetical protein